MSKKETQRKTLAMLVLFFITYIYVEKVANPFFLPEDKAPQKKSGPIIDKDSETIDEEESFSNSIPSLSKGAQSEETARESKEEVITSRESGARLLDKRQIDNLPSLNTIPALGEVRANGILSIESDTQKISLSKLGGRITSLELREYKKDSPQDPELVEMISHKEGMALPLGLLVGEESDLRTEYEVEIFEEDNPAPSDFDLDKILRLDSNRPNIKVVLSGYLPSGRKIRKTFSFNFNSYSFKFDVKIEGSDTDQMFVEWPKLITSKDTSFFDPYDTDGFVWIIGDRSDRLTYTDMKGEASTRHLEGLKWLGFGNKYFASAIVFKGSDLKTETMENNPPPTGSKNGQGALPPTFSSLEKRGKLARALLGVPSAISQMEFEVFSGPKSYPLLEETGFELRRLIDLGKTGIISAPLLSLLNLFYRFVGNYGLAIVLLTIVVKLLLYPLNSTQYKQMKALQALKPELDRIKENIKDRQQQQQALMELYKKKNVNPLGGCLPVLVQMPIFIGLYSALMLSVELRHAPFGMWVQDLSAPDSLVIFGIGIPVLVVLFTASMLVQQWITPTAMDPAQKKAMMVMPIVMFFMFMGFPAGLALYWLTNNIFSIGQQQAIKYNDTHGKSGFKITAVVAIAVYCIAWLCTKF